MSETALLAEFESAEAIVAAARALDGRGLPAHEAYTPYPLPELEGVLKIPRSKAARAVLAGGLFGGIGAFLLQYWLDGIDDPLLVGGRPFFSVPAFIPITFEATVLCGALAGFATWLWLSRLPQLDFYLLGVEGFERASIDRFFLLLPSQQPGFDAEPQAQQLRDAGALRVVLVEEAE